MNNNCLSDKLKAHTASHHQELEKVLVKQMRAVICTEDYIKLLNAFYRFFGALEDRVNFYIGNGELPDYLQRRKSESLAKDIISLGGTLSEKASIEQIPAIENQLSAFGAMYVMEGSTLGGQIICKMLMKQLSIDKSSMLFFQSYGDYLQPMWKSFKMTLDHQAQNIVEEQQVILTANETFMLFKRFLTID